MENRTNNATVMTRACDSILNLIMEFNGPTKEFAVGSWYCQRWQTFNPIVHTRRCTRIVNTIRNETLLDFCPSRLECFKHFHTFLFETQSHQNATRVPIKRGDLPYRNHRASTAMVGRARHREVGRAGPPPPLYRGKHAH